MPKPVSSWASSTIGRGGGGRSPGWAGVGVGERELAADDRLDRRPGLGGGLGELERGEEVAGVGQRHRRHAGGGAELGQRLDRHGAFEQRVGGVQAEVDESRLGHGRDRSSRGAAARKPRASVAIEVERLVDALTQSISVRVKIRLPS